jgi:hypothetical protein
LIDEDSRLNNDTKNILNYKLLEMNFDLQNLQKLKKDFKDKTGMDLFNAAELYVDEYGVENYFASDEDLLFMNEEVVKDVIEKITNAALK